MSAEVDAFLDGLGDEAKGAMRAVLARAYERGFREGMSTAGLSEEELTRRAEVLTAPVTERPPPPETSTGAPIALPVEDAGVAWDDEAAEPEEETEEAPRPISGRATIGTLLRRIERTFQLERFDIDVVVCRRGDRDRRQLKSTTALSRYVRER